MRDIDHFFINITIFFVFYICLCQPIADNFDIKEKVIGILEKNEFDQMRARMMDIDDFLK